MIYRLLMTIALLAAAVVLFFFAWGLSDGTVAAYNASYWAMMLAFFVGIPILAANLRGKGQSGAASALLLLPAFPAFLFLLFVIVTSISPIRWN